MTRGTETVQQKLQLDDGATSQYPFRYGLYLRGRSDDVTKVHRFYVPGMDEGCVRVVGIWRDMENYLLQPTTLLYLNRLQQWFNWALIWGIKIQLASASELTMEVTYKIDRPYHEHELDRAYHAWLKRNPGGTGDDFAAWSKGRISQGYVECEISSCEEPAVIGSTCCVTHQKFA